MAIQVSYPGVYVQEVSSATPIVAAPTSITAFIGRTPSGPTGAPTRVNSWNEAVARFGGLSADHPLAYALWSFFQLGGSQALVVRLEPSSGASGLDAADYLGDRAQKTGLYALEEVPAFQILCIPPDQEGGDTPSEVYQAAAAYCTERRAMLIVDPPVAWAESYTAGKIADIDPAVLGIKEVEHARSTAIYFPRLKVGDPAVGPVRIVAASGAIAGLWASNDMRIGVWDAPAGVEASLMPVGEPQLLLSDTDIDKLNPLGVNALKVLTLYGPVVWGARTLAGGAMGDDDFRYIQTRRLVNFIETSVIGGLRWVAFEPNSPVLWMRIRQEVSDFLNMLWKAGALFGSSVSQAYVLQCDATTTTPEDIAAGVVNIVIGLAVTRPAEFIVLRIQQMTAQAGEG